MKSILHKHLSIYFKACKNGDWLSGVKAFAFLNAAVKFNNTKEQQNTVKVSLGTK